MYYNPMDTLKMIQNAKNEQKQRENNLSTNIISQEHLQNIVERNNALGKTTTQKTQASPGINPNYQYKNKDEDLTPSTRNVPDNPTPTTSGSGGGVGAYYGNIASFQPSAAYTKAMEYTQSLLDRINAGKTSYTDKINDIMSQIENRPQFSYDFNTDPLFQNALQGAMSAGQTAMQDTIGQASALTGGYGSTYATSAANQAYNEFVKGAYDALPEYYGIARNAYDQEGQDLYNRLGMYQTADETEYGRLTNAYGLNLDNANRIYGQEYDNYWQTKNFNENSRQWAAEMAYKQSQAAQSQANWEKEMALKNAQAQEEALTNQYDKLTDKYFQTALGLYNKYGDAVGSKYREWINDLPLSDEDAKKVKDYVMANGDMATYSLQSKNGLGKKDNMYIDQWGNPHSYEELLALGMSAADIKKLKKG
ncbi:MAG: hypothetical protein J6U37_01620 [Lachnospiraceae bacterium]|nr:hypothetical protein [Lachnospiraceae bacterium]